MEVLGLTWFLSRVGHIFSVLSVFVVLLLSLFEPEDLQLPFLQVDVLRFKASMAFSALRARDHSLWSLSIGMRQIKHWLIFAEHPRQTRCPFLHCRISELVTVLQTVQLYISSSFVIKVLLAMLFETVWLDETSVLVKRSLYTD